jgi:hypothetical protein
MCHWTRRVVPLLAVLPFLTTADETAAQNTLSAQDIAEIRQLHAQYNHALDFGDVEAWADTFVEDGTFGNSRGREQLIQFATNFYGTQQGYSRHWNDQLTLSPTDGGATGSIYLTLWSTRTRPPTIITTGVYRDVLVRTPNGWRFQSRDMEGDRPAPADDGG